MDSTIAHPDPNVTTAAAILPDRRRAARASVDGDLWLIDHRSGTTIRCRCVDSSPHGMCLRAPLGYGLRSGQTYRLCSHRPGQSTSPGLGLFVSRWATVVWSRFHLDSDETEVGVALDPTGSLQTVRPEDAPGDGF